MRIETTDYDTYHKRELWLDADTSVSRLIINDLTMRIGSSHVSMAGIGGVGTNYEHRRKGYMRTLYEDSVKYMVDQGYCVSVLFGIENFYNKWGYASSLAEYTAEVKTRDAEVAKSLRRAYNARPVEPTDMPAIVQLYNEFNSNRTGSIVRSVDGFTEFHKGVGWGSKPEAILWEDAHGKLLAYAMWDRKETAVKLAEVAAVDAGLYPSLLYVLAEQAVAKRCETIKMYLPADHPFAEFSQRYGVKWKISFPRYGAGMMRIINQDPLFRAIIPEFDRRIALSIHRGYSGTLTLKTDLGNTHLRIECGHVRITEDPSSSLVLNLPQHTLMQLLTGYRSVLDVINDDNVTTSEDTIPLLQTLFPKGIPFMYSADHF